MGYKKEVNIDRVKIWITMGVDGISKYLESTSYLDVYLLKTGDDIHIGTLSWINPLKTKTVVKNISEIDISDIDGIRFKYTTQKGALWEMGDVGVIKKVEWQFRKSDGQYWTGEKEETNDSKGLAILGHHDTENAEIYDGKSVGDSWELKIKVDTSAEKIIIVKNLTFLTYVPH